MANVNFTNLNKYFSIIDDTYINFGSMQSTSGTLYQYNTTGGDQLDFGGTGLTSGGAQNLLTGGAVTSIKLDINDDSPATPEITITGSWLASTFGIGVGTAAQQRDKFWSAVLFDIDGITFNMGSYANTLHFAGDGANVSDGTTYNGSDDNLDSGAKSLGGGSIITGDYFDIISGAANGGSDRILVGALQVYGDFFDIYAGMSADGGNDTIVPQFLSDNLPSIFVTAGDANTVYGTLNGGADFIDLRGANMTGYANNRTRLIGDAQTVALGGTLNGGDDTIYGSSLGDDIFGDERNANGDVVGGYDSIRGNAGDDYIYASGGNDSVDGGDGADTVDGGDGEDLIMGGDAWFDADSLFGGDGDDTISGGLGADQIDGGLGSDWASFAESTGASATVNLATGAVGGWAAGDTLVSIENLIGTTSADNFVGDANANIFVGGAGADTMNGGAGADTADYSASASAVTVKIWAGTGVGGDAQGDVLSKIENLVGSAFNDRLIGLFNQNNIFNGGDGADYFDGFAGSDSIYGENGDDRIIGGAGGDLIDGGAGNDIASYGASQSAVNVNLATFAVSGGDAAGDILVSIEGVIGSAFADFIVGDGLYNIIQANGGNDTIDGAGGWDLLNGHNGDDLIIGGIGNDTLRGGLHNDTFRFLPGHGADRIDDFGTGGATGNDIIELKSYGAAFDTFAEVMAVATQQGANVYINFGGGDSILLLNVNIGNLNSADFLFT